MPIDVYWHNEQHRILIIKVTGVWTWADYAATNKIINQMTKPLNHPYDSITDMSETTVIPAGSLMEHIGQGINTYPPNFRLSLFVRPPTVLRSILTVLNTSMPHYPKRLVVDSVEEAFLMIANYCQIE